MTAALLFLVLFAPSQVPHNTPIRGGGDTPSQDPLDPLTRVEIDAVRETLAAAGRLTAEVRFATIGLSEPPKEAVLQQRGTDRVGRTAEAVLYDWASSTPLLARIDLRRHRIIFWDTLPSREPPMRRMIRLRMEEVVNRDPRWSQVLQRRGLLGHQGITLVPVLGESRPLPWRDQSRVVRAVGYDGEALAGSQVLPGLSLEIDLTRGRLLALSDTGAVPVPSPPSPPPRMTPTDGQRPAPSFEVRGSQISWRNWRLRFGVHPRRGLELWDIAWVENGRVRSLLYRASVSEVMAVYGDPGFPDWYPRDAGNEGLGTSASNAAVELADAPAGAIYAESILADDFGRPVVIPRAVAIYQRDGGILWRHAGRAERAHQLVVTSHATIDNYDFAFNWIFGQDGAIEIEVNLTGAMLVYRRPAATTGTAPGGGSSHLVAPGILAPSHQHFFSYRLDVDLDGSAPNRVLEQEVLPIRRGRKNPQGLWFTMEEHPLTSEAEARRTVSAPTNRIWKIVNPAALNPYGEPAGYALLPGTSAFPLVAEDSPARHQGGFMNAQLFVTPFRRDEFYAAGEFQNFGWRDQGLSAWTRQDRKLLDTDVVLWYTLGVTHMARPEEFPVMPVARASFRLVPSGFFARNPVLPPPD